MTFLALYEWEKVYVTLVHMTWYLVIYGNFYFLSKSFLLFVAQNRRTPPSHHSPNNSIDEEGSDTQSTADSKGEGSITGHKILESSVEKSAEITRKTESPRESPHIVVRRVSNKPPVSDSDSDNEEDKKPPVIPTTQKSPCLSQKSAISAVSSDRTTIISTSDDEYASPKSSDANSPPLHSTLLSTNGPKGKTPRKGGKTRVRSKSSDRAHENNNNTDVINRKPPLRLVVSDPDGVETVCHSYCADNTSDSDSCDYTLEEMSHIKFRRCSTANSPNTSPVIARKDNNGTGG